MPESKYEKMEVIWRYATEKEVKHMFEKSQPKNHALCGAGFSWYIVPSWKTDEIGLAQRRQCKNCLRIKEGGGAVIKPKS
jgi:hypothetical protein